MILFLATYISNISICEIKWSTGIQGIQVHWPNCIDNKLISHSKGDNLGTDCRLSGMNRQNVEQFFNIVEMGSLRLSKFLREICTCIKSSTNISKYKM